MMMLNTVHDTLERRQVWAAYYEHGHEHGRRSLFLLAAHATIPDGAVPRARTQQALPSIRDDAMWTRTQSERESG